MKKDFKKFLLTWIILFLIIELAMSAFGIGKKDEIPKNLEGSVVIESVKDRFAIGKEIMVNVENLKGEEIQIVEENCKPAFEVFRYNAGVWEEVLFELEECNKEEASLTLASGEKTRYSFLPWNYELFGELGRYKVVLPLDKEYTSPEFTIKKKGLFKRGWDFFFYKPIYNGLIFFTDINPSHSLGVAIVLLTLLLRVILLVPSQKALRSQKRMQEIQPKIQEIQRKYKGNQERIAMETMALWKQAKTNPLGSCLPMLFQFPILIALYYTVREVTMGGNIHNLYLFQQNFDFDSIQTMFLGILDLAEKNIIVLPIIVGLLQFAQMKLTFSLKKTKKDTKKKKEEPKKNPSGMPDMNSMSKTMTYTMPLMIAFFTATLPAGVGLYWGTSTIFGIGQTIVINREKTEDDKVKPNNSSEVTVKVIDKSEEEKREDEKKKYLPKGKKKK